MCEELDDQVSKGQELAKELCGHLEEMGAEQVEIPVTLDSGCYIVNARKTL